MDHPGTYRGLMEKLPYLKDLGVTALELMPVGRKAFADNAKTYPLQGRSSAMFLARKYE